MSDVILVAENIHKIYENGEKLHVLKGVNLRIKKGDIIAVYGPSGSGKSTLLHILGTLDHPTEGDIYINGEKVFEKKDVELAEFRNRWIGFVFQFHHLLPEFTVLENVAMPLLIRGEDERKAFDKALKVLKDVFLEHKKEQKPATLSGGEKQRVAVARALVTNPLIVLADEPTGNLDAKASKDLLELIKQLNRKFNTTVVIVSHDPMVLKYATQKYKLSDGRLKHVVRGV